MSCSEGTQAKPGYGFWEVSGTFIIPGTRTKGSLPITRIGDVDKRTASKHLAILLNKKYAKDLRGRQFNCDFALMHLTWTDVRSNKAIKAA